MASTTAGAHTCTHSVWHPCWLAGRLPAGEQAARPATAISRPSFPAQSLATAVLRSTWLIDEPGHAAAEMGHARGWRISPACATRSPEVGLGWVSRFESGTAKGAELMQAVCRASQVAGGRFGAQTGSYKSADTRWRHNIIHDTTTGSTAPPIMLQLCNCNLLARGHKLPGLCSCYSQSNQRQPLRGGCCARCAGVPFLKRGEALIRHPA